MSSMISFNLDLHLRSTNAHQIRPILPNIFADYDVQRTITINKISSTNPKRLERKHEFLLITPTSVCTSTPLNIDIQSKLGIQLLFSLYFIIFFARLESVILKTVDCEISDLYNQIVIFRLIFLLFRFVKFRFCFRNRNRQRQHSMTISRLFFRNFYQVNINISSVVLLSPIKSIHSPMMPIVRSHK